jgi:hypothetical protein
VQIRFERSVKKPRIKNFGYLVDGFNQIVYTILQAIFADILDLFPTWT